jgi:HAD superfamily phosphatase (TIGR01681 family)
MRAALGLSAKVLVLDLDNTLWGGVAGEDGVAGLSIGPGSADGEAHAAIQTYAKELAARGIVLAVCSKNNRADAEAPFA